MQAQPSQRWVLGLTHVGGADRTSLAAAAGFLGAASGSGSGITIWTRFLAAGAKRVAPSCAAAVSGCLLGPPHTAWELVRADSECRRGLCGGCCWRLRQGVRGGHVA